MKTTTLLFIYFSVFDFLIIKAISRIGKQIDRLDEKFGEPEYDEDSFNPHDSESPYSDD